MTTLADAVIRTPYPSLASSWLDMEINGKIIGITGVGGALGRYLALHYQYRREMHVLPLDRAGFNDPTRLRDVVKRSDILLHFAGVNRAPDAEMEHANPNLARALVDALRETGARPHLVYATSTHEANDSVYGRSKRAAGDLLEAWANAAGAPITRLVLPHIYSELTRPNYNSGIATFCSKVAAEEQPTIMVDAEIYPLHASQMCDVIDAALVQGGSSRATPLGAPWLMSVLLHDIRTMHDLYRHQLIVPDLRAPGHLHLFNSYRAHLYPHGFPVHPKLHSDDRGNLFESVRELNGGQSFISTTKPGITRGNHFHFHKVERFCVLRGEASIAMRPMAGGETVTFHVSGAAPCYVDMPTLWTHNITNTGTSELLTMFWTHEIFDPESPDTYFVPV